MSGIAWTAVLRWSAQIISWIATAVAARLLLPADYGIMSMAMLAVGLVRMVDDIGLDAVLVQDRGIAGDSQARLAGLAILIGASASAAMVILAQPIGAFFREPEVAVVVSVLGTLTLIEALQVIPRAALQRALEYRRLAWAQFMQVVATQSLLVLGAYLGWHHWALVSSTLAGAAVVTLLLIAWHPYAVRWPRGMMKLATPLAQGGRILVSRVAWYVYTSADQTVVGRLLGKDALGAYSFATTFSTTISQEISSVVIRVVPGVFSSVQDRRDELRRYFLILTELLAYLTLPVSFGLAVTADLVVRIVLGPQWDAVVVPLQILCFYAAFVSCQVLNVHVLLWTGQFRANMWLNVLAAVVLPIAFYVGAQQGLRGVAWAWVIAFPLVNVPAFLIAFGTIRIGLGAWVSAIWPALAACLAMSGAVLALRGVLTDAMPALTQGAFSVAAGGVVYAAVLWLFFRRRVLAVVDFLRLIRGRA
ncbi:MAG TPA: lipopolysaccharide biosynthesis protein [Burkholderiales bacterium]|nr:lipopolysaccharide biosynthesis protein [Burkholderiales bacterium]